MSRAGKQNPREYALEVSPSKDWILRFEDVQSVHSQGPTLSFGCPRGLRHLGIGMKILPLFLREARTRLDNGASALLSWPRYTGERGSAPLLGGRTFKKNTGVSRPRAPAKALPITSLLGDTVCLGGITPALYGGGATPRIPRRGCDDAPSVIKCHSSPLKSALAGNLHVIQLIPSMRLWMWICITQVRLLSFQRQLFPASLFASVGPP